MWLQNKKTNTWINIDEALRIFRDGQNGWTVVSRDGVKTQITDDEYNQSLRTLNPEEWWKMHPDGNPKKKAFDVEGAIKSIMKSLKVKEKDNDDDSKE